MADRLKIAILISGRGSNMDQLLALCTARADQIQTVLVAADRPAAGLERASAAGIPAMMLAPADYGGRPAQEQALLKAIREKGADWVFLAGYMALLSADFINSLNGRIINIHPSLLPEFKGLDTHARALAAGRSEHGLSVHLVTAGMDEGPVILQAAVPVLADDDETRLAERVLAAEHICYPAVLAALADGRLQLEPDIIWQAPPDLDRTAANQLLWLECGRRSRLISSP